MAAIVSSGCLVASLRPFYLPDQLIQDDRLVGQWESVEQRTTIVIERGEWNAYRVAYKGPDLGAETTFAVYLTKVADAVFADVSVVSALQKSELVAPLHAIYRVEVTDGALSVRGLDFDWFTRASKQGLLAGLPHTIDDRQHVIFSGAPEVTRRWLAARLKQDGIFTAPVEFRKSSASVGSPSAYADGSPTDAAPLTPANR